MDGLLESGFIYKKYSLISITVIVCLDLDAWFLMK